MKSKIIFKSGEEEFTIKFAAGETILDAAIRGKLPLDHSCGGMGTCGTCRVFIRQGLEKLSPPEDVENEIIQDRGFLKHERLACQNDCVEGLVVEIPNLESQS